MISRKARNRKKVISFVMRLVALIKPGSLSHFQIKMMRLLVLFASFRRAKVNNVVVKKMSLDQLELYLAEILCREIIFVEYKLSPESKYPSQLEDAKKAYSFLLGKKEKSNIILAGDSAGGNLALALLLALKKDKSKKPKGIFCISPWVYPTAIMAEYPDSCCQSDVLIGPFIKRAKETGSGPLSYLYCNPSDHKNPLISPLFGDFKNSPPIMIQYAENEVLSVQIGQFLKRLKKQRVKVVTKIWKDLWHDFQLETDLIETRKSFVLFKDFLDELCT